MSIGTTKNLNLKLPGYDEKANIKVINDNFDTIDDYVSNLVNKIYPIGAIYISVVETDPSILFGGTWTQLKDRFLIGAGDIYKVNSTGGNATVELGHSHIVSAHNHSISHTHTVDVNYAHKHAFNAISAEYYGMVPIINEYGMGMSFWNSSTNKWVIAEDGQTYTMSCKVNKSATNSYNNVNVNVHNTWNNTHYVTDASGTSKTTSSISTSNSGYSSPSTSSSLQSTNIMNPYLGVYMWKRTA